MTKRKLNIFIDANSLSNLSLIEINREKPSVWLWKYFNLLTCQAVKDEFSKHVSHATSNIKAINRKLNNIVISNSYFNIIEQKILENLYNIETSSKKDKGERHLLCCILEQIYFNNISNAVLVTDDQIARNKFLDKVKDDFNFWRIWNSLDLIIYLYFTRNNFSYTAAKEALRDVASLSSIPYKHFIKKGEPEEIGRQRLMKFYFDKIDKIKYFKNQIPK